MGVGEDWYYVCIRRIRGVSLQPQLSQLQQINWGKLTGQSGAPIVGVLDGFLSLSNDILVESRGDR